MTKAFLSLLQDEIGAHPLSCNLSRCCLVGITFNLFNAELNFIAAIKLQSEPCHSGRAAQSRAGYRLPCRWNHGLLSTEPQPRGLERTDLDQLKIYVRVALNFGRLPIQGRCWQT
jgi:hypothetical protein